jgi:hypothetical protein
VLVSGIWPTWRSFSGTTKRRKRSSSVITRIATSCGCTAKFLLTMSTTRFSPTNSPSELWRITSVIHFFRSLIDSVDMSVLCAFETV